MQTDLSKVKKIFFVGIGGIGISAIARMMLGEGKEVSGSDMSESEILEDLKKLGADVKLGQSVLLVPKDTDLVIYSIAIEKYDPEFFKELQVLGIPMRSYPEMLGVITESKYTIAVSGTHGKTTTTAMVAKILVEAKKDPSVIVGSLLKESSSNFRSGKGEIFVVEACEYERSFLNIKPKILVITNIEADHMDYYKDMADLESAFSEMSMQTDSYIVCDPKNPSTANILKKKYKAKVVDYGPYFKEVPKLSVPGRHNKMNAAAALAVADILEIDLEIANKSLSEFSGTSRRLERRGEKNGVIIYDDYAHHPTEIQASLQALRELYPTGSKKITVVFQPHLYSRTKVLFGGFVESFKDADRVLILPVYFARENLDPSVSSDKLAEAMRKEGDNAEAFRDFKSAEEAVVKLNLGPNDVLVTMGAGEAFKVANKVFNI